MTIPCVTLTQPYAQLMALGTKAFETRSWPLPKKHENATMGIHAGKGFGYFGGMAAYIEECTANEYIYSALEDADLVPFTWSADALRALPFGALVATVQFIDCVRIEKVKELPNDLRLIHGTSTWRDEPVKYFLSPQEHAVGDYGIGRFVWVSNAVQRLVPTTAKGMQGIWNYSGLLTTFTSEERPSSEALSPS